MRLGGHVGNRHLMSPPGTFGFLAVDGFGPGPPLGAAQHDHGPARPFRLRNASARGGLDGVDSAHGTIHRRGHGLVHAGGIVALDEDRIVPIAGQQSGKLIVV